MTDKVAPLVCAEVDLRGYEFMPFYGHHLLGSEFHAQASDAAWRAGVTLWWAAWNQVPAASLPDDDVALARLADFGRDVKAWRKVRDSALHGFIRCSDGRLYHRFLAPLAIEAWGRRVKERARKARWRAGQERSGDGDKARDRNVPLDVPSEGTERLKGEERTGKGEEIQLQPLRGLSGEAPDVNPPAAKNGHDQIKNRELRAQAVAALNFLNEKTGRTFEPVKANVDPIIARMKEGSTLEDVRAVIAKKCREWGTDEKMAAYLRPKTLFRASNFANYKGELGAANA